MSTPYGRNWCFRRPSKLQCSSYFNSLTFHQIFVGFPRQRKKHFHGGLKQKIPGSGPILPSSEARNPGSELGLSYSEIPRTAPHTPRVSDYRLPSKAQNLFIFVSFLLQDAQFKWSFTDRRCMDKKSFISKTIQYKLQRLHS